MEKTKIKDIDVTYERRGKGTPLVLIHGFPMDHHLWDEVVPLLEDDFDLIVPDLRGFGGSSTVDAEFGMEDYAADIAGLLDHLGVEKAAIVGHSMGGYVALALARFYADRVSGLGLVASQAPADPPERKEGRYKSAAEVADKGPASVIDMMSTKFTTDQRLQALSRESMEKQKPAAFIGGLKAMAERMDSTSMLATFKFPMVIVHGTDDALIPIDRAREVKAAVPHAHLVELEGVGHIPMLEAPEKTAEALKRLA